MTRHISISALSAIISCTVFLSACSGIPVKGERETYARIDTIGTALDQRPSLPDATESDAISPYVRYALWTHPRVKAAYARWRAGVSDATAARSLPDPRLTLQFDYAGGLMSMMPGISSAYTTRGKREAKGEAALASSEVAYRQYVSTLLDVAANLRNTWIDLAYADESVRLQETLVSTYDRAADAARNDYVTARNANLSKITELGREAAKQKAEMESLEERRTAARAAFKAALGLGRDVVDPVWPTRRLDKSVLPGDEELWAHIKSSNPELLKLRAAIEEAVAGATLANTARTPDFDIGLMTDIKANPLMFRPEAGVSLPIWRDKIRAETNAAKERLTAAKADEKTEEIALAADLADALYRVHEADRNIDYLDTVALPSLQTTVAIATADYQSGTGMATAPAMAQAMRIAVEIERLHLLRTREKAVTNLRLMAAGIAPEAAPLTTPDAPTLH